MILKRHLSSYRPNIRVEGNLIWKKLNDKQISCSVHKCKQTMDAILAAILIMVHHTKRCLRYKNNKLWQIMVTDLAV